MDKNLSVLCTEHLKASIKEICAIKIKKGELDKNLEVKIPMQEIIEQVKEQFGYYLPYLLLKRSKKIRKVRFERILDDHYRIQDTLTIKVADYK